MPADRIGQVLAKHAHILMRIPGVIGAGQGESAGSPCITVLVVQDTPDLRKKIPPTLAGYPVVVQETGPIQALDHE